MMNREFDDDFGHAGFAGRDSGADAVEQQTRRESGGDGDDLCAGAAEVGAGGDSGSPPPTQRTSLGVFLLGAFFCVGFPALWTAVAPVSYVRLERHGDVVRAQSKTCLLFFVPYRRQRVERVVGVNDRFRAGQVTRRRSHETGTRSEDEAFLILHGEAEDEFLEVSVSPASIKSRVRLVEEFLNDPTAQELRLFCASNWKFAVFAGGLISLLTVLWAVGTLLAIVRLFLRLVCP